MDELVNLRKTLHQLKAFLSTPIKTDRDRAGIVQAFEFTFAQAWKSIQKIAGKQGMEIGNPKRAFSYAMQNGWIPNSKESAWLQLLKDRNLTAHTYDEPLAKAVIDRIKKKYVSQFEELLKALETER